MNGETLYEKEVVGQTVNFKERTTETVIANPSAVASEQLEKLQVGNTVYNIPKGGGGNYVLELAGESGTLTDEQYQAVVDNFPNVVILQDGIMYDLVKTSLVETGIYRFVAQSIQNGNNIVVLSYSINADKTWLFTTYEVEIPTSSGGKLYKHDIRVSTSGRVFLYFTLYSTKESLITDLDSLRQYLNDNHKTIENPCICSGAVYRSSKYCPIIYMYYDNVAYITPENTIGVAWPVSVTSTVSVTVTEM